MNKIILLVCLLGLSWVSSAQGRKDTIMDAKYGKGGYRVEHARLNENGDREDHVEYYDKDDNKKERVTKTSKDYGVTVTTTIRFDCRGGQASKSEVKKDKNGRIVEEIHETYDEKTKEVKSGYKRVMENGEMKLYVLDEETGDYVPAKFDAPPLKFEFDLRKKELKLTSCCQPRHDISFGYSFLAATGENGENFPLGAHLIYTYLLTRSYGLVADMSIHSKEENDLRVTRAFLMGGLQYQLSKPREKAFLLYLRLLIGLASDRVKYGSGENSSSKANAMAIAAGMRLSYPLSKSISVALLPDYILTLFNKETQGNIRVSAGIQFRFGCK